MTLGEFEDFYEIQMPKIYRHFFYKVLSREIAEDLTSQTFLKFTKELTTKVIENPRAYLYGIAKYVMLDFLREKYKANETPLDETDETLEVKPEDEPEIDIIEHLERMLPLLPEQQATVLRYRFIDKLSLQKIAAIVGKDVNYVSTTQKRAFQSIRKVLGCTEKTTNISG